MGNLEIELDTNTAPIVSVTQRELRDIQLLSLRLFLENVTQVIEIMKNDEDFAQFLIRNFCDRSVGFFDRSKLISWIENSFYHKKTYLGEQATFFSFDADELNDELEVDLEIGDFVEEDEHFRNWHSFEYECGHEHGIRITNVIEYLEFDPAKGKDFVIVIDEEVEG